MHLCGWIGSFKMTLMCNHTSGGAPLPMIRNLQKNKNQKMFFFVNDRLYPQ